MVLTMTNAEFQQHLQNIYDSHDVIGKSAQKTVNELFYMLRQDKTVTDYNVNLLHENGSCICVPSVKETFVTIGSLKMHVSKVECEEEDYGFDGLCLNVYVEE
jgi:hypothetical protein